jgi:RNA polymerase subunit RPABC4/transcription elongation factor Spt4
MNTDKCPRCGTNELGYPALSRTDNETDICSECGIFEALEQWRGFLMPKGEWANA